MDREHEMSDQDKTKIMTTTNRVASTDDDVSKIVRPTDPKVAQLEIVEGAGKGNVLAVFHGQNDIGSGESARVRVNFGDATIGSRTSLLLCDGKAKTYRLSQGMYPNPILVNGQRLSEARLIASGDTIKIGQTTFRFTVV
jgi:hypothetical protein